MGEGDVQVVDVIIIQVVNIKLSAEGKTRAATKAATN
jgi:hypothetical protein